MSQMQAGQLRSGHMTAELHSEDTPFRHREILLTTCLVVGAGLVSFMLAEPLAQGVESMFNGLLERGQQVLDSHYAFARS